MENPLVLKIVNMQCSPYIHNDKKHEEPPLKTGKALCELISHTFFCEGRNEISGPAPITTHFRKQPKESNSGYKKAERFCSGLN